MMTFTELINEHKYGIRGYKIYFYSLMVGSEREPIDESYIDVL